MLAVIMGAAAFLNLKPPPPAQFFRTVQRAVYTADRARDELLSGIKRVALDGDALSRLVPFEYSLDPSSTVAMTGATDGIGREAALFLAKAGYCVVICARDLEKAERTIQYYVEEC